MYLFTQINCQHKYLWIFKKIQHKVHVNFNRFIFYTGAGNKKQNFIHFKKQTQRHKRNLKKKFTLVIPNLRIERARQRENCS